MNEAVLVIQILSFLAVILSFSHQLYSVHIRKSNKNSIEIMNEIDNNQDTNADGTTHSYQNRKNVLKINNSSESDSLMKKQLIAGGKASQLFSIFGNKNNAVSYDEENPSPFTRSSSMEDIQGRSKYTTEAINGYFDALMVESGAARRSSEINANIDRKQKEPIEEGTSIESEKSPRPVNSKARLKKQEKPNEYTFTREQLDELRKNCIIEVKKHTDEVKRQLVASSKKSTIDDLITEPKITGALNEECNDDIV